MKKLNIALLLAVVALAVYLSVLSPATMQSLQAGFLSFLAPFLRTGTAMQEQIGSMGKGLKTLDEVEADNRKLTEVNRVLLTTNNLLREIVCVEEDVFQVCGEHGLEAHQMTSTSILPSSFWPEEVTTRTST